MATMDKLIRMMYLKNTLDSAKQAKKTRTLNTQLKLYKATSEPKIKQAESLVELSKKTDNIQDLNSVLQSLSTLKIGVGNHDTQISINEAEVKTKMAAVNASMQIKNETDKLMKSYETEGYKEVVDKIENQKNIISASINKETLKGLNDSLAEVREREEGLTRMLPYDTNLSTSNIDFPKVGYGYQGTPDEAYNPRTPGGEIDQAKKNQMESMRLSPEEKNYLTDVIQPEYDVARKINTQEGWQDFNTLMKTMPTTLRTENRSNLSDANQARLDNEKQAKINAIDRKLSGYKSTIAEVVKGINPIGLPNFDTNMTEGLPPQVKIIMKSIPDVSIYGNRNAENALQSYDPKGLLGQIDEAILQMLDPNLKISAGNEKDPKKEVKEYSNNPKFLTSDPTKREEDYTGHRDIMDEIISISMDTEIGEYKLHDQFDELSLKANLKNWILQKGEKQQVREPLFIKSQTIVEKMVQLRQQLLNDIESKIFDPYEDSQIGNKVVNKVATKNTVFSKRKKRG